jgi:glycosyltransferase involved in cell wall biosynthesis
MEIDVIIPTYNRSYYLEKTIKSVLNQSYEKINIIISDNCSTDGTKGVVETFLSDSRVKYFCNNSNLGMVGNWKKALNEYSNAKYVLILSDDDLLIDKSFIYLSVELLRKNNLCLVHGNQLIIDKNGCPLEKGYIKKLPTIIDGKLFLEKFMSTKDYTLNLSSVIFDRQKVIEADLLNHEVMSVDFLMFLYIMYDSKIGFIDKLTSGYRLHDNNVSSSGFQKWVDNGEYLKFLFKKIEEKGHLTERENNNALKVLLKRYCKSRLVIRLYKTFSYQNLVIYLKFCKKENILYSSIFYLINLRLIASSIFR